MCWSYTGALSSVTPPILLMASLRIFLADDDPRARRVISALLGFHSGWQLCGETANGQDAIEQVLRLKPDIALLDADMPKVNGLEACRQIVQRDPARKVIMLVTAGTEQMVVDVFHAGAHGFVVKPSATHDLAPAIEAVQRGQTCFTPRFANMILKSYLQGDAAAVSLTDREQETIRLLTEELTLTLRHPWRRPRIAAELIKYLAFAGLALATAGIWWYELNGEPEHGPPMVENLLVNLGLRSRAAPITGGNPDAKVWIDMHTGLYYCSGAPYYGRTSKGRVSTQRVAQLDRFEPASGKACE